MAWPWDDDDPRANGGNLDELIRAYGRGEIDLPWGRGALDRAPPLGLAPAGVTYPMKPIGIARNDVPLPPMVQFSGPTAAERRGGLGALDPTPVSFAGGVQAIPWVTPPPLPPANPGAPNQIGKALSDIWHDISGWLHPPGAGANRQPNDRYDDGCEDQNRLDRINCQTVRSIYGRPAGRFAGKWPNSATQSACREEYPIYALRRIGGGSLIDSAGTRRHEWN